MGLVPWLIKFSTALRSRYTKEWVEGAAGHWDDAAKGNSSLRAAMLRVFADEKVTLCGGGLVAAITLWDLKSFYDTPRIILVINHALGRGFPRTLS